MTDYLIFSILYLLLFDFYFIFFKLPELACDPKHHFLYRIPQRKIILKNMSLSKIMLFGKIILLHLFIYFKTISGHLHDEIHGLSAKLQIKKEEMQQFLCDYYKKVLMYLLLIMVPLSS